MFSLAHLLQEAQCCLKYHPCQIDCYKGSTIIEWVKCRQLSLNYANWSFPRSLCKVQRTYLFFVKKTPCKPNQINQSTTDEMNPCHFFHISQGLGKKPSTVGTDFWISWFLSSPFKFRDFNDVNLKISLGGAEKTSKNITQNGNSCKK